MRIGIVNDTPFSVIALKRTLSLNTDNKVVWVAQNGVEAVAMAAKETPDLILMDLLMPVMDGVEATRQIMEKSPCAILIVTASIASNSTRVFEAMGHGALDAVNTPELGSGSMERAAPFLAKVAMIGKLIRGRPLPTATGDAPVSASRGSDKLVAIGASAGGPAALGVLLKSLPKDFPAAIVIVQHVDEHFASGMAEWLGQRSALPVRVARDGDRLAAGTVLLAGTSDHLRLNSSDTLGYTPDPRDEPYRPSVDVFFNSVADHWRGQVSGVLLTGMGRDGAQGLKNLRDRGHHTIAQDQATSAVYGMPKAAAALDAAVDILPISRIAGRLIESFPAKK